MIKTLLASAMTLVLADGQSFETDISLSSPTRIIFEDDRPTKLIFNEAGTNAPSIAAVLGSSGDIFVTVESGIIGQKISGFMTTESGKTYPVKFKISARESSQVTVASAALREASRAKEIKTETQAPLKTVEWDKGAGYTNSLGNLIKALYYHQNPEGFVKKRASKLPSFGNDEFLARPYKYFVAENMESIIYVMESKVDYSVYVPTQLEDLPDYLAMSYNQEHLEPNRTGFLYLVRKREVK